MNFDLIIVDLILWEIMRCHSKCNRHIHQNTRYYCYVYSKLLIFRCYNTDRHTLHTAFCSTLCQDNIVKTLSVANKRWKRSMYMYMCMYICIYIYIYNLGGETWKLGVDGRVIFKWSLRACSSWHRAHRQTCHCGNRLLGSLKCEQVSDQRKGHRCPEKNSASWN